jgi:predicted nucleic acid-binding protein
VKRILVDTDVCLDLLSRREPFYFHAARIFTLADQRKLSVSVCSLSFPNLNYLLCQENTTAEARRRLTQFKTIVHVIAVDDKVIELALQSDFKDFEDGIQYYSAVQSGIKTLVTRNIRII